MNRSCSIEAFHGTNSQFNEFLISDRGSFGKGIYFTNTLEVALLYVDDDDNSSIVTVQIDMRNPYYHRIEEPELTDQWGGRIG